MPKSERQLKVYIQKKIPARTLLAILNFVKREEPALWGLVRGRGYEHRCTLAALYKDMTGIGYCKLASEIATWLNVPSTTLQHNTEVIRRILGKWGEERIVLGTLQDWQQASRNMKWKKEIKGSCLWMDSVDFRLKGKRSVSRKDPSWSYKCNSPGQRYMFLLDAKTRVRKLWGGYYPKTHDGSFMKLERRWCERNLHKAVILGDQHFQWAKTHYTDVTFHTPIKKPSNPKGTPKERRKVLTPTQEEYNKIVRAARARVELPFSEFKTNFKALNQPWLSSEEQMDCLVYFAAGLHNEELGRRRQVLRR
jgi:hypothetical protein